MFTFAEGQRQPLIRALETARGGQLEEAAPQLGMDTTTLHVLVVVFVATLIRSTFGFGEALIAVPLLALSIPIEVAAPLAVLLSITIALVVVAQDWRQIHMTSTAWLLGPTFVGIPLGVMLLTSAHEHLVKGVLGAVIVAFSGYFLVGSRPPELQSDSKRWLIGCGFVAGVLGGAYGMNGPPLVIYGAMRRWSPQHFRATLQGYFLPASIVAMGGYWVAGLWVPAVTRYYLVSLVVVLPTILVGRVLNRRLRGDAFLRYVHGLLVCVGIVLLVQAVLNGRSGRRAGVGLMEQPLGPAITISIRTQTELGGH